MAILKGKTPVFKDITGEMDTGGAPIYADDILRIQENSAADTLNYFEAVRRLTPELLYYQGGPPLATEFENGLILSGMEYDNTDPANPVVSPGYILSGGVVCYYPGATYNTGGVNPGLLYVWKGAETFTSRVFNAGGSKEILVENGVNIELGIVGVNGPELPGGTAIVPADEVIVLQIGVSNSFNGEDHFTIQAGLKTQELGAQLSESSFVSAGSFLPNVTVGSALPYMVSRVKNNGKTEIVGSVNVGAAAQAGGNILLFNLAAHNIDSGNSIPLGAESTTASVNVDDVSINVFGDVRLTPPGGVWPGVDFQIIFNAEVLGTTTLPTEYSYISDFLNIT